SADDKHALPRLWNSVVGCVIKLAAHVVAQTLEITNNCSQSVCMVLHEQTLHILCDKHFWLDPRNNFYHRAIQAAPLPIEAGTFSIDGDVLARKSTDNNVSRGRETVKH